MTSPESTKHLEVEVKFYINDRGAIRQRLGELGAVQRKARTFERNVRFDSPWDGLRRAGKLLRLRQDDGVRLTFKGPVPDDSRSEVKVREELELYINDFSQAALLLQRIGFEARQTYEKYRETFELGGLEIVLDEMPFGDFLELEGSESAIKLAAEGLGLNWEERILTNYLALMGFVRIHYGLAFDDLTFERFVGNRYPIGPVLSKLREKQQLLADDLPTD